MDRLFWKYWQKVRAIISLFMHHIEGYIRVGVSHDSRTSSQGAKVDPNQTNWQVLGLDRILQADPAPKKLARAITHEAARCTVEDALGLSQNQEYDRIETPLGNVLVVREMTHHITRKLRDHREVFANRILPTLQDPLEIWNVLYDNGQYRRHYIKAYQDRNDWRKFMLAITIEDNGEELLYNFFPAKSSSKRAGALLYSRDDSGKVSRGS